MCYNSNRISADPKQFGGTTMIKLGEKIKSLRNQKNIFFTLFHKGKKDHIKQHLFLLRIQTFSPFFQTTNLFEIKSHRANIKRIKRERIKV